MSDQGKEAFFKREIWLGGAFHLQTKLVGNHGDEFAVGGLSAASVDGIAEIGV